MTDSWSGSAGGADFPWFCFSLFIPVCCYSFLSSLTLVLVQFSRIGMFCFGMTGEVLAPLAEPDRNPGPLG